MTVIDRTNPSTRGPGDLTARSLRLFFIGAFAVSWGAIALYVPFQERVDAVFGEMGYTHPVFVLAVYAPGLVGTFMVWHHYGVHGLGRFLRRFTLWRMRVGWWLTLLVGMPLVFYGGALITGDSFDPYTFSPWYALVPALLPMLFIGPIEELGWRGVALPLLQRRFAPLWAGLILSVLVAVWHTPAFLLGGTKQSSWAFWPFFFGVVAIGLILTVMFNASRGSLLVAFLFHAQMNNPTWPDAQPWDSLLFVVVALLIVFLNREALLSRASAVTDVLVPEGSVPGPGDGLR